jgi:hypothetical protein
MARVRTRTLTYDAVTLGIAIALFLAAAAVTAGWDLSLDRTWHRAGAIALVAATLAALVVVRLERARWLTEEAIYEDFDVFAAHVAPAQGVGRYFMIAGHADGAVLPHVFRGRVLPIRTAYDELQLARRIGGLDEHSFRIAVDELYAHAELRAMRAARG